MSSSDVATATAESPAGRKPFEGQLNKFTNVVKGWQNRWFLLDPERGRLDYYVAREDR